MQKYDLTWTPFFAFLSKEIHRFLRVINQTILVPLVNSTLYFLIFGVSLGGQIHISSEATYLAFLVPGLVMMGVLDNAFQNSSSSIATSKFHGDLEDLRALPIHPLQIVGAFAIGGLIRGLSVGVVVFTVGEVFHWIYYKELLPLVHPGILLLFLIIGGLTFSLLGISIAFYARTIDQLGAIGGFVLLPLMYLGGVFFSLQSLPAFWQALSKANPMLYFINGVRYGILGHSDVPWERGLLVSLISLFALFFISLKTVETAPYQRW